jgi:poly-gamma-glutamate synthesis protein (capsule biosynthesis protein)
VYEEYRDGFIAYGQGNFVFNPYPDARPWLYEGYGIVVDLSIGKPPDVELVPVNQPGTEPGIRLLDSETAAEFRERLAELSAKIADPEFVEEQWLELCRSNRQLYLSILRGQGRILRNVNKRIPLNDFFYSDLQALVLYNAVHCESKHEELATILADMIDKQQR